MTSAKEQQIDSTVLTNARGTEVRVIALGAAIMSVRVPDRRGVFSDVVLGYDSPIAYAHDTRYLGVVVGRYANRIANATFRIDGESYRLAPNDGPHQLHGGPRGFHRAVWDLQPFGPDVGAGARLHYTSPAGEEGFPGELEATVTYTLTNANELVVDYHATCDRPTHVNLSQHTYFNLAGHDAGDVLDHELTLHASRFTPVDAGLIPTGELRSVQGGPFDFATPRRIGDRIDSDDAQLRLGGGYDHNFVIDRRPGDGLVPAARLFEPASGRVLEVSTTEPGIQVYSGNTLGDGSGAAGKGGHAYANRSGIALETQHFPDTPNQPSFPSSLIRPDRAYRSTTVYRFSVA